MSEKIIGQTIEDFRQITQAELDYEGWKDDHRTAFVLVLSNGLKVYASRDDEGNGPGILFWNDGSQGMIFMPGGG